MKRKLLDDCDMEMLSNTTSFKRPKLEDTDTINVVMIPLDNTQKEIIKQVSVFRTLN